MIRICRTCYSMSIKKSINIQPHEMIFRHFKHSIKSGLRREQNNLCKICKIDLIKEPVTPVIDHDHETGKIRGIICNKCNILVACYERNGSFKPTKKNQNLIKSMDIYLNGLSDIQKLIIKNEVKKFEEIII